MEWTESKRKNRLYLLNFQEAAIRILYSAALNSIYGFPMLYLAAKGLSYTQIGVIASLDNFVAAVSQAVFPIILRRNRKLTIRQLILFLYSLAILFSFFLYWIPQNFWFYLLVFNLISITEYSTSSLLNSMVMEMVNKGIWVDFGKISALGSLAYGVASVFLGKLIGAYNLDILPAANIGLVGALIGSILLVKKIDFYGPVQLFTASRGKTELQDASSSVKTFIKRYPLFMYFLIATLIIFVGTNLMSSKYAPNYIMRFGGNVNEMGKVLLATAIFEFQPGFFFDKIIKKVRIDWLLMVSAAGFIMKSILVSLATSMNLLICAQVFQCFGYGIFVVACVYFANAIIPDGDRIMAQGLLSGVMSIGAMIAYFIGGIILDQIGIIGLGRGSEIFCIAGGIPVVLCAVWAEKKMPEKINKIIS